MDLKRTSFLSGLVLSAWIGAPGAQPPPTPLTTPGQVGDTLKKPPEIQLPQPPAQVEGGRAPASAPAAGGKAVRIDSFEFQGNTLLDPADLQAAVAKDVGRSMTLFDIYEVADKLTALYVAKGYTLASVIVPAQRIADGIARLEVIEGRVGKVSVEGNRRYREESILDYLQGVAPGYPYRGAELGEGLTRLNRLPGLSTRAVLRPGEDFGSSDVVILATEDNFSASGTVDNFGREDVGALRYSASGTFNGPLKAEDQLQVLGLVSEAGLLSYGFVSYSVPANIHGTRIALSYGEAQFEVKDVAGLEGENKNGRIKVTHPLLQARSTRLNLGIGLSNTTGDADIDGIALSGGTDLSLLELDADLLHAWREGMTSQATLGLSSNFDEADFDAINPVDPADKPRDDQRFRAELDVLHLQALPRRLDALIRVAGVWSPDPLPDTEKFSLGGPGSVRGYPTSEVRGDRGVLGSITLRRAFTLGPVAMFGSVFADSGTVTSLDLPRVRALNPPSRTQSLSSLGLGLEGSYRRYSGKLDWAFPMDQHEASDGQNDSRLFGSLSVSF
ncbi:MAG: ShlB/FhaC/HecB family hemolysin secretion/activation protein [Panacagrimonas sp.]